MIPLIAKALIPAFLIFFPIYGGLKMYRYFKNNNMGESEIDYPSDDEFV